MILRIGADPTLVHHAQECSVDFGSGQAGEGRRVIRGLTLRSLGSWTGHTTSCRLSSTFNNNSSTPPNDALPRRRSPRTPSPTLRLPPPETDAHPRTATMPSHELITVLIPLPTLVLTTLIDTTTSLQSLLEQLVEENRAQLEREIVGRAGAGIEDWGLVRVRRRVAGSEWAEGEVVDDGARLHICRR